MRKISFSKNELDYLKNTEAVEHKYEKNYIYQIRHSIKQKIIRIANDLEVLGVYTHNTGWIYGGRGLNVIPIIQVLRKHYSCNV